MPINNTTIYDLGFDSNLNVPSLFEDNNRMQNNFSNGVNPNIIQSGDLNGNLSMVKGDMQSENYEEGSTGWRFDAEGNLEANDGTFRGALNVADNWHVDTSGNMWWGDFEDYASATIKISSAGASFLSGATISGNITAGSGSNIPFDKVTAANNSNTLGLGGSNVQLKGGVPAIILNDGTYDRVLIGYDSGGF